MVLLILFLIQQVIKLTVGAVLTMLENRFHSIFWQISLAISNSD